MKCKSCQNSITESHNYCSNCGSKIINNRLSLKGTWKEFIGPFFNWENNFWRTFIGLFKNPKAVLESYISGARKKYFQPFSYLLLYATIALFFYKFFPIEIDSDIAIMLAEGNKISTSKNEVNEFNAIDTTQWIMNYYNIFITLCIPIYAFISYITFRRKEHNYSEHLVFNSYLQANIGFVSILLHITLVLTLNLLVTATLAQMIFSILFYIISFKKLYQLNNKQTLLSSLKFIGVFAAIFTSTLILIVLLIVTGIFI